MKCDTLSVAQVSYCGRGEFSKRKEYLRLVASGWHPAQANNLFVPLWAGPHRVVSSKLAG